MKVQEIFEAIDRNTTLSKYGQLLSKHKEQLNPADVIDAAISSDPTPQGKYVQWILQRYISGGIQRAEDFGRVSSALEYFDRRKRRLPAEQRDIQRFASISDLEDAAELLSSEEERSGKELKRSERDAVMKQVKVFYSGPEGKILTPTTEEASCFLGRGTRWCTAGEKNNQFDYYNEKGPLYVIMTSDKRKYQFHLSTGQLMDEREIGVLISVNSNKNISGCLTI